jgi:hypothetical protein
MENAITDRWRKEHYPLPAKKVGLLWLSAGLSLVASVSAAADIIVLACTGGLGRWEWKVLPLVAALALFSLGVYSSFRRLQGHRAAVARSGSR